MKPLYARRIDRSRIFVLAQQAGIKAAWPNGADYPGSAATLRPGVATEMGTVRKQVVFWLFLAGDPVELFLAGDPVERAVGWLLGPAPADLAGVHVIFGDVVHRGAGRDVPV